MKSWGKLAIGVRCGSSADPMFLQSWTKLLVKGLRPDDKVLLPVIELPQHYAADALVHSFLKTDCDSLLIIDDDMIFQPEDLAALRDDAEGFEYDMLQALCLSRNPPHYPVMLEPFGKDKFKVRAQAPKDEIVDVAIVGLAFTLCRRELFAKVATCKEDNEMFFRWSYRGDSEDASFSALALEAGCRLGVNTRVCIGHRIPVVVTWDHEAKGVAYQEKERVFGKALPHAERYQQCTEKETL